MYIKKDLFLQNLFENITIQSDEESIYIGGYISQKLNLKELNITSNNSYGIEIGSYVGNGLLIEDSVITADKIGFYSTPKVKTKIEIF